MKASGWRVLALGLTLGGAFALGGCSSGGGGSDHTASTDTKTCVAVTGPLDPVQTQIATLGFGLLSKIPGGAGLPANDMSDALIGMTDAVDALAMSLASLQQNQDPQAFATSLASMGPSMDCAASQAQTALGVIQASGALGNTPAAAAIGPLLTQLQAVRDQLAGSGASADDLTALASQLQDLATGMSSFGNQVPVSYIPMMKNMSLAFAAASAGVSDALTATVALDSDGVTTAVTTMMTALQGQFTGAPTGTQLDALIDGIGTAIGQISPLFASALNQVLPTLFDALGQVLAQTGGGDVLGGVIGGVLGGDTSTGGLGDLLGKIAGGGSVGGVQIPVLSTILGGLL